MNKVSKLRGSVVEKVTSTEKTPVEKTHEQFHGLKLN